MAPPAVLLSHPAALTACSNVLAGWSLWREAADFGRRAAWAGPLEEGERIELAWRLLRSGSAVEALDQLAGLPDDRHPVLPLLRVTAAAVRDGRPEDLADLLRIVAARPPTRIGLRLVVLAALAVGDRAVALDAAARYLAAVDGDDPDMRRLMAPEQALADDMAVAVSSAEHASVAQPGDADTPVREIAEEIRRRGPAEVVIRFLAQGYAATGRRVYGELLAAELPRRTRHRNDVMAAGFVVMALGLGLGLGLGGLAEPLVILTGMLGGLAVAVGAALIRVPGTTRRQTQPVLQAYATFRSRQEGSRVMWPAVGSAAACFAWLIMMNRGDRDSVPPAVILRMAAVSVLVGAVVAVVAWLRRRSQRRAQVGPAEVSGERCRCWETDLVVGRHWNRYLADHLVEVASDDGLNATLRRCPTTEKVWLHLPERDVAVSVRLPAEPEPEPDRPIGLYL